MKRIYIVTVIVFIISNWFLSKAFAEVIINDRLSLIETKTKFSSTPVTGGPAGTFTITATFKNVSTDELIELAFHVVKLTGGNLLLNADGGAGGVGSTLTVPFTGDYFDGLLSPSESFTVDFIIGLASRKRFEFFVDALGGFPDLEFVFPFPNQVVAGDNVLIWVAEVGIPIGVSEKGVVFETSLDGQNFELLPQQLTPDFGLGSHSTALDTTAFPPGPLFLRTRFEDRETGPIIQVFVVEEEPSPEETPAPCGCKEMVVFDGGNSTVKDPRRNAPVRLGFDAEFLTFNFEVQATLTEGSEAKDCAEGQFVKGTFNDGGKVIHKTTCTRGLIGKHQCDINKRGRDCDTGKCSLDNKFCNPNDEKDNCILRGGRCPSNNDGVCTEYPNTPRGMRGDDDFAAPNIVKMHNPTTIIWLDPPGKKTKRADQKADLRLDADFLAFVAGQNGVCSCHFTLTIDWDGTNQRPRAATGTKVVRDRETMNCR